MSRVLAPPALESIANIALKSVKGQEIAAKELWADKPVLLYVMRRPGCSACHAASPTPPTSPALRPAAGPAPAAHTHPPTPRSCRSPVPRPGAKGVGAPQGAGAPGAQAGLRGARVDPARGEARRAGPSPPPEPPQAAAARPQAPLQPLPARCWAGRRHASQLYALPAADRRLLPRVLGGRAVPRPRQGLLPGGAVSCRGRGCGPPPSSP
jgi:hypothetical protein